MTDEAGEPTLGHDEDEAPTSFGHDDIVRRLLDYQRRLRELSGEALAAEDVRETRAPAAVAIETEHEDVVVAVPEVIVAAQERADPSGGEPEVEAVAPAAMATAEAPASEITPEPTEALALLDSLRARVDAFAAEVGEELSRIEAALRESSA